MSRHAAWATSRSVPVYRHPGRFTSSDANTASVWPTWAGVMSVDRQPIRSADFSSRFCSFDSLARPNRTGRPVSGSGSTPTLFLVSHTPGSRAAASRTSDWA